ncbi:MAG: hypothetical protein KZQ64_07290 [gamma proteobacterium symbiont of Bathyaustriella thionipta]|nr:hypothetical protein [gamma proteobacterium symbiont of Bathyaustriella thionipta]MCU7951356.1 hypothetical protein [gamma proteobacterium symbiont of Bathyaustriella thionipta]MCU7953176.1 hypothetical protein [gamma proteobacterium symbiont of Bathyaustriella thionipta]MCU7957910.1 hypothetical protein [gamma proteobacterium symbiont of Bathyaustriella thionipta]MCU7965967.1 hypothetical protein [gamma proteobacterium symbiont of Bathyaustriella thionipta]
MSSQIIELVYDLVDEKKVSIDKLEGLSREIDMALQGLLINIQTVGEMITNSAEGTFSDTEAMSGHVVAGLGDYAQSLLNVKVYIDDYLKKQGGSSHE